MFKLVIIAGKLRGQEFELQDGESIVGRDPSSDVHIPVDGVSKQHFSVAVTGEHVFLKDLGSSNGTFLNGKMLQSQTAENGDKITIPNTIIQLVYVKEEKVIIKKMVTIDDDEDDEESVLDGGLPPDALPAKLKHQFKYKAMNFFYGMNKEYEWNILLGIIFAVLVLLVISVTIYPVIQDSRKLLYYETIKRGAHFADEIARINSRALGQKKLDNVDTGFLEKEASVKDYVLFDLEGRVVRPIAKLNSYISDSFSVRARDWALSKDPREVISTKLSGGVIGIAQRISAYNPKVGSLEKVGVIVIQFAPRSLMIQATKNTAAYLTALLYSSVVAIFFFGVIYFLTIRPVEELKVQIEECLRGKRKSVESDYLMRELVPLKNMINSILQRNRELQQDEDMGDFAEIEDDASYVSILAEFMRGSGVPSIVLNSEKQIQKMNSEAEDLLGIREASSLNEDVMDVCRDQGIAGTLIELCNMSANNNGTSQQGEYSLTGKDYEIFVTSLIGKDNFAKAFFITFVTE